MAVLLVLSSCGSSDEGEAATTAVSTSAPESDTGDTTTTSTTVKVTTTIANTSTTSSTTTLDPVVSTGVLDCTSTDPILDLLWNDWSAGRSDVRVFPAFGSDEPPAGRLSIVAFDPDANVLAGIWEFPAPQGDGLAQGIVWSNGTITGEVYYLDGVDPIATGDVQLLERHDAGIVIELSTDQGGEALTVDCVELVAPRPITGDDRLTIYGIGAVRAGMTLAEVVQATGHTTSDPSSELEISGGVCFHVDLQGTDVLLQMNGLGPDSSPFDATVGAVIVLTPRYSTPSAISIGTSQAEVEAALGSQLEISPHAYEDGSYLDFVPNDPAEQHLRLRFVVTDGAVSEMRAGLAEWTGLVEGCA